MFIKAWAWISEPQGIIMIYDKNFHATNNMQVETHYHETDWDGIHMKYM